MGRFIILGICVLLGVSYFSHPFGLSQSPSNMKGQPQTVSESVIENEKNIATTNVALLCACARNN